MQEGLQQDLYDYVIKKVKEYVFEELIDFLRRPAGCLNKRRTPVIDENDRGYIEYQRELYNAIAVINIVIYSLNDHIKLDF